jgi:carbonic anhydrase
VEAARAANPDRPVDPEAVGRLHLERTVTGLLEASEILSAAVADGNLAIVGAQYRLAEGRVERHVAIGAL